FGPRRDAEARRLPFFAVNRFDSASTWTIRNNPKAHAHGQTWSNMAIWQEGEGQWEVSPATDTSPATPGPHQTWTHEEGLDGRTWRTSGATLLGANLTSGPGVYVHNLAMRGGSGTLFDDVPDADWKALQTHTNPTLVVLQFGGNAVPSISNEKGAKRYAKKVGQNIRHIQAQWPGVPILFIGPSDMGAAPSTYPGLPHTVAALRDTALANHALHWDLQTVMGGPGAMAQWVDLRWAGDDHVHFSVRGAQEAAQRLLQALAHERALWANQRVQPAKLMAP
ncbi:MAG: GDSL-type esterase/lipase family protein, partial [Flavobacteriales bacterium]